MLCVCSFKCDVEQHRLLACSADTHDLIESQRQRGLPSRSPTLKLPAAGPTRHLKTLKDAEPAAKLAVYQAVEASSLHDARLKMYKISESLDGQPFEVPRRSHTA